MIKIDTLLEQFILKAENLEKNNGISGLNTGIIDV